VQRFQSNRRLVAAALRAGRLDGVAVRVPVEDGSLTDLAVLLSREAAGDEVNAAFAAAAGATSPPSSAPSSNRLFK
jgi:glyceraldehyde-3-phosphate dehydrogenase/erythrose-4-phosphate dehydrogenase